MNSPTKTTVDWFRYRTQSTPGEVVEAMRPMFGPHSDFISLGKHIRGLHGYRHGLPIMMADVPVARMDFGGDSQRGWLRVEMPAKGCAFVDDWAGVDALENLERSELSRADIALTTWRGEVNHCQVVQAHNLGRFTTKGRPPDMRQILSSNPNAGQTVYIGNRASSKFLRCYEKGRELAVNHPGLTHAEGFPIEDIYRVELELKSTKAAEVPWDVIERRDQYFAGAYPFCADILPGVEADILQRRPEKAPQRDLAAALANVRQQYGATLFTALHAHHGDIGAVWDLVCGDKHNEALLEAGVLLVDHETV